jgi:catechol 2,3-dioxygenase-like lactoylglutathione lyase family enzyme
MRVLVSKKKEIQATIGHVGIEISDLKKTRKFYEVLLKGLSFQLVMETGEAVGFSNQNFMVWLSKSSPTRIKREAPTGEEYIVSDHLAILVPDKETVNTITREMEKNGFTSLFPPEEHPEFMPGYYAVSFCDPDHYVIEVYTKPQQK